MSVIDGIRIPPLAARAYFSLQSAAGALWWIGVFTSAPVRRATLGDLPVLPVAFVDIPLFVVSSALVALGVRAAAWVVAPWTALVATGMVVYATLTGQAGWGALLMIAAAAGSVAAAVVVLQGRAPTEWLTRGPCAFRSAPPDSSARLLTRTGLQTLLFWGLFLVVFPLVIALLEWRWGLHVEFPLLLRLAGAPLLIAATGLGVWSAVSMSLLGAGTPLPSSMPRHLVVSGPYRLVRNPMAVAGIAQGVAVGLLVGSWLVVLYALCGSVIWNILVRPLEEADLAARFGTDFDDYRARVSCWIPGRKREERGNEKNP